ncbi:MAG: hypothetical protein ACRC80_14545 [Waterburya sp.]
MPQESNQDLIQVVNSLSQAVAIGFETVKTQNAEIKTQNAEIKTQNADLQLKLEDVKTRLIRVETRLERIEENTIIIRDRVISDFEGISAQTKTEIETLAVAAIEKWADEILPVAESFNRSNPEYKTPENKARRTTVRKEGTRVGKLLEEFNPICDGTFKTNSGRSVCEIGYKTACGNWVSSVMGQLFQYPFQRGQYPPQLNRLVETLVGFWALERVENGRLY